MSSHAAWIDTTARLRELMEAVGSGPLALDTEADSFHHYHDKVCLIQMSHPGGHALIDPLAEVDVSAMQPVLEAATVPKVMHGADYDLRILDRDFGLRISGLFDTMVAARLLGHREFGLAALLRGELGVTVDKKFQRADWSLRPLPEEMGDYAVEDTRHLEELARRLRERLVATGRLAWAEEEFTRIEEVRWRREENDAETFRRVRGSTSLDRRSLAVLAEIFAFREEIARRRDVPRFRVLRDEIVMEIVKERPVKADEVARVPGMPRPFRKGEKAEGIATAVRRALEKNENDLPEIRRAAKKRRDRPTDTRFKALRSRRDELAAELDLEPQVLASGAVLEAIARVVDRGGSIDEIPEIRSWQRNLLRKIV